MLSGSGLPAFSNRNPWVHLPGDPNRATLSPYNLLNVLLAHRLLGFLFLSDRMHHDQPEQTRQKKIIFDLTLTSD
jgi:hypothetical protein